MVSSKKMIMKPVLLDFNGTLFSDTCFHMEAWSEIYRELHENTNEVPDSSFFCGPRNDDIIHAIAPDMPRQKESSAQCTKKLYTAPFAGKILISCI